MSTKKPSKSTIQLRSLRLKIGSNINHYRTAKGLSLAKLGRQTSIGIKNLDLFEAGRGDLELQQLAKIAAAMEIRIDNLLC